MDDDEGMLADQIADGGVLPEGWRMPKQRGPYPQLLHDVLLLLREHDAAWGTIRITEAVLGEGAPRSTHVYDTLRAHPWYFRSHRYRRSRVWRLTTRGWVDAGRLERGAGDLRAMIHAARRHHASVTTP